MPHVFDQDAGLPIQLLRLVANVALFGSALTRLGLALIGLAVRLFEGGVSQGTRRSRRVMRSSWLASMRPSWSWTVVTPSATNWT